MEKKERVHFARYQGSEGTAMRTNAVLCHVLHTSGVWGIAVRDGLTSSQTPPRYLHYGSEQIPARRQFHQEATGHGWHGHSPDTSHHLGSGSGRMLLTLAWWDRAGKGPLLFSGGLEPFPALPSHACTCWRMETQTFPWFYFKQAKVSLVPRLLTLKERSCSFFFFYSKHPSLPHTGTLARCRLEGEDLWTCTALGSL